MVKRWVSRATVYREGGGDLRLGDAVAVKYVTVIGAWSDFAVYIGVGDWSDERVAANGDKVSEEVGRAVAPYCSHLAYRG